MLLRTRIRRTGVALLLAGCLGLPASPPAHAMMDDMFGVMFRMMLVMMNVMSDAMLGNNNWGNSNWGNNLGGMNAFNMGMTAFPAMSGMGSPWNSFGYTPWGHAGGVPWGATPWNNSRSPYGGGYPANYGAPGYYGDIPPPYPAVSLLEGRWIGNSGELLEIVGDRFRLRTPGATLDGQLTIDNNILSMYSPQTNTVTRYTFARNQYELILNNGSAVLTFRTAPQHVF